MTQYPDNKELNWSEDDLQIAAASYLDGLEKAGVLAWNHPPNEGKRDPWYAAKLKKKGMKPGQPDCEIFLNGGKTIFIELKTITNAVTKEQGRRLSFLGKMGYEWHIVLANTPQHAVTQIENILKNAGAIA